jgi:hypothetical protein
MAEGLTGFGVVVRGVDKFLRKKRGSGSLREDLKESFPPVVSFNTEILDPGG